tara:strand:+ start:283 stop:483 length:201 start_codon:yes stop_codon:yes gene_type:complete
VPLSINDINDINDINNKSKGYILKNGGYSKKLRVGSLKKSRIDGGSVVMLQWFRQEFLQNYSVTVE